VAGLVRTTAMAAGCFGGVSAAYGLLFEQSKRARRMIGLLATGASLRADGVYLPDGTGPLDAGPLDAGPIRLAMLGDSLAVGLGAETESHLPGVLVASGLAEESGRPVRLDTYAVSGSTSRDLALQVELALADAPDVALILIGANDVTKRIRLQTAATLLGEAVRRLRAEGVAVVVGTCPDLAVVRSIPQPLRGVVHTWSLTLSRLQRAAVYHAGGHAVSLADLLTPEFLIRADYFSSDRFHPSGAGYEAAVAVLLPTVCAAVGGWGGVALPKLPSRAATDAQSPTVRLVGAANRRLDRVLRRAPSRAAMAEA
jgi:lysophospholipase L1-like esterase